ncbi:MAG TPA: type VI secretion system baseplate subunit TssK [Candidatus Sulfotelmatobacter sp.]|nr:type VI secretion system baseplate subunit TssK [Candidatus Sulfotelmatobacter sp.]
MKLLSRVVWAEGMYLAPQHFQAQNRFFEEAVHFATASLWKHAYGLASCQLDEDALRNGTVSLLNARGMFQDGLPFDIPESDLQPETFNIAEQFLPATESVTVALAVPRWVSGQQNCEIDPIASGKVRYTSVVEMMYDETTGADEKPVQIGRKNIRIVALPIEDANLLTIPIARVMRDQTGHFVYDPTHVATCVRLSASERLTSMLQRLVQILEEKSAVLSQEQHSGSTFQAGMSARQVAQFWFLHAINSSLTPLRHILLAKHGHPEELFREMSRLAGALCTFGLDTHPRSLPAYDHYDPGPAFAILEEHILRHLEIIVPSQAIVIPLKAAARYFYQGEIRDQRCMGRSRWILGVRSAIGEADLIAKTLQLVKVCSAQFVTELVKRALPGLTLTHMTVPPAAISAKVDSQYFLITRNGPCWEHIMRTRNVGVYIPGELPVPETELIVLVES